MSTCNVVAVWKKPCGVAKVQSSQHSIGKCFSQTQVLVGHGFMFNLTPTIRGPRMGIGSVVVGSALLGRPDFQSGGSKTVIFKGFQEICGKIWGTPKADPTMTDPTPHSGPSDTKLQRYADIPSADFFDKLSCAKLSGKNKARRL